MSLSFSVILEVVLPRLLGNQAVSLDNDDIVSFAALSQEHLGDSGGLFTPEFSGALEGLRECFLVDLRSAVSGIFVDCERFVDGLYQGKYSKDGKLTGIPKEDLSVPEDGFGK